MSLKITPRYNQDRGNADHGWLKTFHTFSFAMYQDYNHEQFGCLRVINEDRVQPSTGFGTHGHREFEIFSYVVAGELEHRDSMGNVEVLKRGDLQMTSTGTGIRHSEKCHGSKQVHFLQIWSLPFTQGLSPQYFTRHFTDEQKQNAWVSVVAPVGSEGVSESREASGPAPVHSPLTLWATLLPPSASRPHTFPSNIQSPLRKAYIHVVQTSGYNTQAASGATIKVGDGPSAVELKEGDGAYIMGEAGGHLHVENVGESIAEILLFDVE